MADPDLQIREGPGHPDPEIRRAGGGGRSKKQFFPPFGSQFGLTIGGPSPGSATERTWLAQGSLGR